MAWRVDTKTGGVFRVLDRSGPLAGRILVIGRANHIEADHRE
jgi:hypothetical protein